MNTLKTVIFVFLLFVGSIAFTTAQELGEIHDAVFSPDGNKIGIGTETGFHVYDRNTLEHELTLPTPNGVHFIRWSPDGDKVLLVFWNKEDQEGKLPIDWDINPTYWVYDLIQQKLILKFQEEIRWLHFYRYNLPGGYGSYTYLKISIDIPDIGCAHPYSIQFSQDGSRLIWITSGNQVRELDLTTSKFNTIVPQFNESEFIVSVGFIHDSQDLWVSALDEESPVSTRLIFFQIKEGVYQRIREETLQSIALDHSSDGNWWLVLEPYPWIHPTVIGSLNTMKHSLYSLSEKKSLRYLDGGGNRGGGTFRVRSTFINSEPRLKTLYFSVLLDESQLFTTYEYDINAMRVSNKSPSLEQIGFGTYLLQPFSPDGEEFLHIREGKLFIYDTDTFDGEEVLPKQSAVSGFERIK